jgi:hypothetical protein
MRNVLPFATNQLWPWLAALAAVLVAFAALPLMGRLWFCECGQLRFFILEARSPHTSQHFLDPYSLTHVLHGLLLYWPLAWWLPRLSVAWRFAIAITIEAVWEVFENTAFVIERYRDATAALGYSGDTVVNMLGDLATCGLGFFVARQLGLRGTAALLIVAEVVLIYWIRDSLLLNVIMLLFPSETLKQWQAGG